MKIDKFIAPSLLAADFSDLKNEIISLGKEAQYLHLDIMDGLFVPNITFGPMIVKSIVKTANEIGDFKFDTHLMIKNPDKYIEDFVKAGSNIVTVHQESTLHLDRTVSLIKDLGVKAGVAINPSTPCSVLKNIIKKLDLILIMTVNPGFGGQKFIDYTLEKIIEVKKMKDEYNPDLIIEVDGGINENNIGRVYEAGAELFVAGSSVFKAEDRGKKLKILKNNALR